MYRGANLPSRRRREAQSAPVWACRRPAGVLVFAEVFGLDNHAIVRAERLAALD